MLPLVHETMPELGDDILHAIDTGVVVLDNHHTVIYFNEAANSIFDAKLTLHKTLYDVFNSFKFTNTKGAELHANKLLDKLIQPKIHQFGNHIVGI